MNTKKTPKIPERQTAHRMLIEHQMACLINPHVSPCYLQAVAAELKRLSPPPPDGAPREMHRVKGMGQ